MGEELGESKGFGFVCFEDPKSAVKAATELHQNITVNSSENEPTKEEGKEEDGEGLYVRRAVKKELRKAQLR